jgi:hypothetical protein
MQKKASKNDEAGINEMMKMLGFAPRSQKRLATKALINFANLNRQFLNQFLSRVEQGKKQLDRATIIRLIKLAYYKVTNQNTVCASIVWHIPGSSRNKHATRSCPAYNWLNYEEDEEEREGPECDPFFEPPVPKELSSPVKRKFNEIDSEEEIQSPSEAESESNAASATGEEEADEELDPFEFDDD